MAQRVVTSFVNTNIPGAYPNVTVKSNPVGLGASGNVVIIGEADGGDHYGNVVLAENSFTPDQLARVEQAYLGGAIVDAFRAFSAPSADSDISGSANRIYIVKTNAGTKASAVVDTDYGTLRDQNWGKGGNKYKYQVTSIAAEAAPSKTGTAIPAFGATLNGVEFKIRVNGGAETTVTLSGTSGDHADRATLLVELNALLPAGVSAQAGAAANTIEIFLDADAAAYRKGWGKSFELIDSSPGDLAALGLTAGLSVSAQEPGVEVAISNPATGLSETLDVNSEIALQVGYLGTTATLTINQTLKTLATTVTGGAGANLAIDLTQYRTIADLAAYIASQAGYSASAAASAQQLPTSALDAVSAQPICSTASGLKPGRIKSAMDAFKKKLATSGALEFVATAQAGLPSPMASAVFLAGGAKGATLAADIIAAVNQLAGINVNIVIPLFSRDATADITDGLTESTSTYTIDAVHAAVKSHCIQYSTPKLKRHRQAALSFWGSYADAKAKAQALASFRCTMTFQRPSQVDSAGNIVKFLPWYGACVAAGMQAGGFYKSITNKLANVISFEDPSGFDSGSPGDVEEALDAGLLMLSKDTAGSRWVSDQTTYGFDTNFVYNSMQAVYTSDILSLDLADSFQKAFVGKSLADVDAATALSFLAQKMDGYKKIKLIASSDDAPLGFKNAKIGISAPTMDVAVEVKLATAIYFVPISISISQVQSSAGE
jgi:hypothetical protein